MVAGFSRILSYTKPVFSGTMDEEERATIAIWLGKARGA